MLFLWREHSRQTFEKYDTDYDGFVHVDSFRRVLALKGLRTSKQVCLDIIHCFNR